MADPAESAPSPEVAALRAEVVRLNKMVTALMNRAEREMSAHGTDFGMFHTAVTLEKQVRERTQELQAALRENERINRALQREKDEQQVLIKRLEDAHNQLLQSEKLASIGQLAAGVAHEINNPIGFVSSNLGTLKKYVDDLLRLFDDSCHAIEPLLAKDDATRKVIEDLRRNADMDFLREDICTLVSESIDGASRVRRIVNDLRDFSRSGDGRLEWVDLHAGLESTLNVVWNEIKYKATVEKDYGDIPLTLCHPQALNQVFMNLLVNAAQAIEVQGTIRIRTWYEDETIFVSIADSGQGIPAENLSRLFEPFFTTKEVGKGTGLGLSVSYDIVKKHDGEIRVGSTPGQGSIFTVVIPVVREERHGA
jgi:two-component system NtrC family sensor kinase